MEVEGIDEVEFPEMYSIEQIFPEKKVEDLTATIKAEMAKVKLDEAVNPGDTVAITAGSRGIARMPDILKGIVTEVKKVGGEPIIVPAMGSHGGATAEGQKEVLEGYGITKEYVGAPIKSSMETVQVGETDFGLPVFMDKIAYNAEAIIPLNRVKVHTDFSAVTESGILKVMAIGLGKQKGAATIHDHGLKGLKEYIPEVAKVMIDNAPVIFGVGIVENAYEELYTVEAILPQNIHKREQELLAKQKDLMPGLPFEEIDVLFIDEMGKDISGVGIDTNVIGRMKIKGAKEPEYPDIEFIIVSNLKDSSHGNATGIGLADITTRRLFEKIDLDQTYANIITSTFPERGKIPIIAENDELALKIALKMVGNINYEEAKIVRIKNTLELTELEVSKAFLDVVEKRENLELVEKSGLEFDEAGMLIEVIE